MGSYYDFRVGGYSVLSGKYEIENEVLSLFIEADKVAARVAPDLPSETEHLHEGDEFIGYSATAQIIADRLDLMGFTPERARSDFSVLVKGQAAQELEWSEEWAEKGDELYLTLSTGPRNRAEFLSTLTFERWLDAVRGLKEEGIRWPNFDEAPNAYARPLNTLEAFILEAGFNNEDPHLGYYCSDVRYLLRAVILCSDPAEAVALDCSDMVAAGYFTASDPLTTTAKQRITTGARTVERILILTEGRSDTRILKATLDILYPHLRDFISFLNHESFSVAGGAGNLLNLIRGFAGAGVSNRVVALFDNDTAGSVQLTKTRAMILPENFRVLQLPYLSSATEYPTLGPSGLVEMDINGSACSIELYLGRSALTDQNGRLTPVQWIGYERSVSRYQGELLDKFSAQERYITALQQGTADLVDMRAVLQQVLGAFNE